MKLTVLGCAGSFPGPDSPCSAYLVEADDFRLLIDFGTGSMSSLQRHASLHCIDAIILTHLHCDHMLDACSYMVVRRYAPEGHYPPIPLYGPAGSARRILDAYGHAEGPVDDVYTCHDLAPGKLTVGPFTVTVDQVSHPVETYGLRLEHHGKTLAYSSDSAPCDQLTELARDADLFLCEASYLDGATNPPGLHLTGGEAGRIAAAAGARRLVLTHLVAAWGDEQRTLDAAHAAFDGPIDVARPGAQYLL